jgi:hypothetical protein
MSEIISEAQRQARETASKVNNISRFGADSPDATLAYRRASYHRQAWAACSAEATALMAFAKLTGRA